MRILLSILSLIYSSSNIHTQKFIQIIEKNESNKDLFERNSPTSLIQLIDKNNFSLSPMDFQSAKALQNQLTIDKDLYRTIENNVPLKNSIGEDSIILIDNSYLFVYPDPDTIFIKTEGCSHILITYDSTVKKKSDVSILKIDSLFFLYKNNSNEFIKTAGINFKEIINSKKITYISNEITDINVINRIEQLKTEYKEKIQSWDKLYPEITLDILSNDIYLISSPYFKGHFNFGFDECISNNSNIEQDYYFNRSNYPFGCYYPLVMYQRMQLGTNHIYRVTLGLPLSNHNYGDSVIIKVIDEILPVYEYQIVYSPADTNVLWADYPTDKLYLRYSAELKNDLSFSYSLEDIYLVATINNSQECVYNFNKNEHFEIEFFKSLEYPDFNQSFYQTLNNNKHLEPDWIIELKASCSRKKGILDLSKTSTIKKLKKNKIIFFHSIY